MGFLARAKSYLHRVTASADDSFGGNWTSLNEYIANFKTLSGARVTESSAMGLSAYYACLRCIAEDIGKLPLITYRRLERGKERATNHANFAALHDAPNPDMSAMSFRETLTHWALGWGNGFAEIATDGYGKPALFPIHPSRVRVRRSKAAAGGLVYAVRNEDGTEVAIPQGSMLHIHGLGGDGAVGYSVLRYAAESVGLGLSAQSFGAAFFGNGANAGSVLEHPGQMKPAAYERLRKEWTEIYTGTENANKPAILENGMKFNRISIPPNEAQFLETRQFNVEDICRWFRVPPHKVQHLMRAQGWSTLDASNTDYLTDTLLPWLVRWEQELKRKLFVGDNEHFAEHLVAGIMRGDMKTRSDYYRTQFAIGSLSVNDIREAENMNPVDGGDEHFVPLNMIPLRLAAEGRGNGGPNQPVA